MINPIRDWALSILAIVALAGCSDSHKGGTVQACGAPSEPACVSEQEPICSSGQVGPACADARAAEAAHAGRGVDGTPVQPN